SSNGWCSVGVGGPRLWLRGICGTRGDPDRKRIILAGSRDGLARTLFLDMPLERGVAGGAKPFSKALAARIELCAMGPIRLQPSGISQLSRGPFRSAGTGAITLAAEQSRSGESRRHDRHGNVAVLPEIGNA